MIHAIDARRDIAILRTKLIGISISIRQDEPVIGSHVCALGNSFGLGTGMTCGIVSAVRRSNIGFNDIEDFIQTDAAVNPGMSGGALVDPQGRLLGLIDGIFTKEDEHKQSNTEHKLESNSAKDEKTFLFWFTGRPHVHRSAALGGSP
mgnify:CR=1 FL=1